MKTHFCGVHSLFIGFVLLSFFESSHLTLRGQGTAFTYQGRLNSAGAPANGSYDLRFKLFVDPLGNTQAGSAVLTNAVPVANGLFSVMLDFGAGVFTGTNYWLEIDVKTNGAAGYIDLAPLQALTPVPYAVFAENVVNGGLSTGTYTNAVTLSNPSNNFSGSFTGNGAGVSNVNAIALNGLSAAAFWQLGGNNVAAGQFLGSTNNQPLEIWANGARALRFEPNTNGAPNVIGGAPVNFVDPGVVGATIAGGGTVTGNFYLGAGSNHVAAIFGTIAGGRMNTIWADHGFIGGGITNTVLPYSYDAVIGGGVGNLLETNAYDSVIGGGFFNTIQNDLSYAVISGGQGNTVGAGDNYTTIGGGGSNTIQTNARSSTISGGYSNLVASGAIRSTIAGGYTQTIGTNSDHSTISGGQANTIQANSDHSVIAGGSSNLVSANAPFGFVVGGYNQIGAGYSSVSGGQSNVVWPSSDHSFIGGGQGNTIYSNGFQSVIGGGTANRIFALDGVVGGGQGNGVWYYFGTVGGGEYNATFGNSCAICGGAHNTANGSASTIGGGYLNSALANYAIVPGGYSNTASGQYSFAAGKRAQAGNDGSFVWADSQDADFSSTAPNQFLIRAAGGVGIGTPNPQTALHIYAPQAAQLRLQDNTYGYYWNIYSESFGASGNLLFVPDSGLGGYISRASGNYFSLSDVRLKRNITPLEDVLERVLQLRPVSYHFRAESPNAPRTYGLIAQEVEPLFPEVVGECGGMKSLAYSELVPVTIGALQELNKKLTEQLEQKQTEIAELKRQSQSLEKRLQALENHFLTRETQGSNQEHHE